MLKVIDKGWRRIKKEMRAMTSNEVVVGVQGDESPRKEGVTMQEVATVNEFGSPLNGIPERSYLRSSFDENRAKYVVLMGKVLNGMYRGRFSGQAAMGILGQKVESDVKKKITDLKKPKNAPATIALKGFDNPLIHTGALRASIRYLVRRG